MEASEILTGMARGKLTAFDSMVEEQVPEDPEGDLCLRQF